MEDPWWQLLVQISSGRKGHSSSTLGLEALRPHETMGGYFRKERSQELWSKHLVKGHYRGILSCLCYSASRLYIKIFDHGSCESMQSHPTYICLNMSQNCMRCCKNICVYMCIECLHATGYLHVSACGCMQVCICKRKCTW